MFFLLLLLLLKGMFFVEVALPPIPTTMVQVGRERERYMNCLCLGFWVGGTVMKLELGLGLVLLGCWV